MPKRVGIQVLQSIVMRSQNMALLLYSKGPENVIFPVL